MDGGRTLKHKFLWSPKCPAPLMARDLMCELNLTLSADSYGISIEEAPQITCSKFEPQWAYEWQIKDVDWAEMILKLAKDRTTPINTEFMTPDKMHCTSHVVVERDSQYEETWFSGVENESVKFDKIFWTENVCVLSASLNEQQLTLMIY